MVIASFWNRSSIHIFLESCGEVTVFGTLFSAWNNPHAKRDTLLEWQILFPYRGLIVLVVVQLLNSVSLFVTSWTAARQTSLSFTISQSLFKLKSIELVMLSNHLILLLPSPPALSLSQHQVLFQHVGSLHQVAKVLELQHQFFQWMFRVDFLLELTGLILQSKSLSRVFSRTTVQKHQFFCAQPCLWSPSHIHTWLLGKP